MERHSILKMYDDFKDEGKKSHYSAPMTNLLSSIYENCVQFLNDIAKDELKSLVPNKRYFAFNNGKKLSRAINKDLYDPDLEKWKTLKAAMEAKNLDNLTPEEITKTLYTMAICFCAFVDLIKNNDQKTPGTFFEYFVAYFYTWRVGVEPQNSIQILNIDGENTELKTDFVYNMGANQKKFHMPIKTSTRERSIMLWAHQRLLDGVYGIERFMGTPVLLAETKTSKAKKEVVEICLPEQWRVYQLYIAKLKRIYYLDIPDAYLKLGDVFPPLIVKQFGDFFFEYEELAPS